MDKSPKRMTRNHKTPQENIGSTLFYRSLSNFVSPQPRKIKAKINKQDLIKPKSYHTEKTTNKMKRQPIELE